MSSTKAKADGPQPDQVHTDPWPERDGCIVHVRIGDNYEMLFSVSDILVHRRELASEVAIDWVPLGGAEKAGRGFPVRPLTRQSVNWRSPSSVNNLYSRLASYYETMGLPWKVIVEWAASGVDEHIRRPLDFEDPEWNEDPVGRYQVWPLIPESGVAVWFGPGDSGKGLLACCALFVLANMGDSMRPLELREPTKGRWYYLDYEDSKREWDARLTRLASGAGVYLPGNVQRIPGREPFAEMTDGLLDRMAGDMGGLFIDSALAATGGDIKDPEPVRLFFHAAHRFNCPVILIAHETKQENDYYPYGNIFWHNLARATINVRSALRNPFQPPYERQILLRSRKRNNGVGFADMAMSLTFSDDNAGEKPPWTRLRSLHMASLVPELQEKRALSQRIESLLLEEPDQTVTGLAEILGAKPDTVKRNLQRGSQFLTREGGAGGRGQASHWRVVQREPA